MFTAEGDIGNWLMCDLMGVSGLEMQGGFKTSELSSSSLATPILYLGSFGFLCEAREPSAKRNISRFVIL
jgi:hypothetical protein